MKRARRVRDVATRAGAPFVVHVEAVARRPHGRHHRAGCPVLRDHTPVVVDDVVSSGQTMVATVHRLVEAALTSPVCLAVHALFAAHPAGNYRHRAAARAGDCRSGPGAHAMTTPPGRRHLDAAVARGPTRSRSGTPPAAPSRSLLCLDYSRRGPRYLWTAFLLLPLALVLDVLDGTAWRGSTGAASRCSAPISTRSPTSSHSASRRRARLHTGLRGGWDMLVLSYFVVCGVSRPAR